MRLLTFLCHIIRKESLENLTLTRHIEVKTGRGKHRVPYLTILYKWIVEVDSKTANNAKSYKVCEFLGAMIAQVLKGSRTS